MNEFDQRRKNIQIKFEEESDKIDLMLKNKEIDDDEYFKLMNDLSYEEEIWYCELAEDEYNKSIYG